MNKKEYAEKYHEYKRARAFYTFWYWTWVATWIGMGILTIFQKISILVPLGYLMTSMLILLAWDASEKSSQLRIELGIDSLEGETNEKTD